jgi:CelD/BcsL family acetyltransferase involved in cellulose biosynthesis
MSGGEGRAISAVAAAVRTRVLSGFDDATFRRERWEALLERTGSDNVYLTWEWQRAWWEAFHPGELLLIVAEREHEVVALAPLYQRSGMVFFVGAGYDEADNLDFVGDLDTEVVAGILDAARAQVDEFEGFQLDFVPEGSRTPLILPDAAARLGLSCYVEWELPAPWVDLGPEGHEPAPIDNARVRKRERWLARRGNLEVKRFDSGREIACELGAFFDQHVARWSTTEIPSRFLEPKSRDFYLRLTRLAGESGWLRFMRLDWDGRPIAFHYGYCYRGRYVWNVSSFDPELARLSPGQVLLRQLLLAAVEDGARTFDLGTQAQPFKQRVASGVRRVSGWQLYPSSREG